MPSASAVHTPQGNPFFALARHPLKFRLFLLQRLPSAFFAGLRIRTLNEQGCTVSVPFKRFTQNPFRSTYFACLAMAAEMSTGVLVMAQVYKRQPPVSMLVLGMESKFHKKAVSDTFFTCNDYAAVQEAAAQTLHTGEPQTIKTYSRGVDAQGTLIAEFWITWTLKAKR